MADFHTGDGSQGLSALLRGPSHGTIDFMGFARGAALADEMNWRDRLRSQDEIRLQRSMDDEQHERQARTYMASLLTNMQTAASAGVDPTDFFIQQREQMLADPNFQAMPAEVQHLVINRLGNSAALQLQALKNAGDVQGIQRLSDAFGLTSPVNAPAMAGHVGDYGAQINAINAMYGSDIQLSPDGSTVSMAGLSMPAHEAIAVLNQTGNSVPALQQALHEWATASELRGRHLQARERMGFDEFGFPLSTPQSEPTPSEIAQLFLPPGAGRAQAAAGVGQTAPLTATPAQPGQADWRDLARQYGYTPPAQPSLGPVGAPTPALPVQQTVTPTPPVGVPQRWGGAEVQRPSLLRNLGSWFMNLDNSEGQALLSPHPGVQTHQRMLQGQ